MYVDLEHGKYRANYSLTHSYYTRRFPKCKGIHHDFSYFRLPGREGVDETRNIW